MTVILLALLIAGHHFSLYWLVGTVLLDILVLFIKLNFLAIVVRRCVEEAIANYTPPPSA